MKPRIPSSLKAEHDDLHGELSKLIKLPGKTGSAARKVADLLHPHFVKEEDLALPPLGLLQQIAGDHIPENVSSIIMDTERLKLELPQMLADHMQIVDALRELQRAATAENYPDAAAFADKLVLHALMEEQVMYPAAILVGEFLKLKIDALEKEIIKPHKA